MEIHKPKAAHSWREFLIEIGTIICGILIALSLEQGIEWLHQRHTAELERETLRKEVEVDLNWMAFRLKSDDCVKARIAEVQNILLQWSPTKTLPSPLWIGRPLTALVGLGAYDSAVSTGRIALLSQDEQSRYASLHFLFRALEDNQTRERTAWSRLQVLEGNPLTTRRSRPSYCLLYRSRRASADGW